MKTIQPFNGLSPAQVERLSILAEECGEVIQAVGKILRHGYESVDPTGQKKGTNRQQLEVEIGDILAARSLMAQCGDIDLFATNKAKAIKLDRLCSGKYTHHQ